MYAARSTSTKEKKLTSPPSRRSFAKRSPSTVLASRNLRRKQSLKGARKRLVGSGSLGSKAAGTDMLTEISSTGHSLDARPATRRHSLVDQCCVTHGTT